MSAGAGEVAHNLGNHLGKRVRLNQDGFVTDDVRAVMLISLPLTKGKHR